MTNRLIQILVLSLVVVIILGVWGVISPGHMPSLEWFVELDALTPVVAGLLLAINAVLLHQRQLQRNEQDTFKGAIEHLGHNSESVRLGGIYALYGLADKPRYKKDVHEILCAHIRSKTNEKTYKTAHKSEPSTEIQTLLGLLTSKSKNLVFIAEDGPLKVNLRGAYLHGAHLQEAQLQGTNLRKAQLQSAKLQNAQLQGADLRGAQLQGAYLWDAQLQGANLWSAQLQSAYLWDTQLQGANLRDAQLQRADLQDAQLQDADLREAQLQEADLWGTQLQRADLGGADLRDAQLKFTDLRKAQLQSAKLRNAQLQHADLRKAQLQGADLQDAQLQNAVLFRTHLQGADLRAAQLQAYLAEAQLQGADLRDAQLQNAILFRTHLQGADLRDAQLQSAYLLEAQLQGANLQGAQLQGAESGISSILRRYRTMLSAEGIKKRVGEPTNLDTVVFAGGVSTAQLEKIERNMDLKATHWDNDSLHRKIKKQLKSLLQELEKEHVGKPKITGADKKESSQYLKDAQIGSYTFEEAGQWITKYNKKATDSYK